MKGIFISYRRGGAGGHAAGRIETSLKDRFGRDLVFLDVQDISPGQNFDKAIDAALTQCHAFVVVLDRHWRSEEQIQRLHDPADYVRREITAALERDAVIFPILIDGTAMPNELSLPDCLQSLTRYQALSLRHETFDNDIGLLIKAIEQHYLELKAIENSMQCPRCRAAVKISLFQTSTRCDSCKTEIMVLKVVPAQSYAVQNESRSRLSRLLELAEIDAENKNYHSAYEQYSQILDFHPDSWEAIINKAICLFWIGSEDLSHLEEVFSLLDKADLLSNLHPRVSAARKSLAYNLAVIAEAEDMVGLGITWSLELFNFSKSILPVHEDRDQLIHSYVGECFKKIQKRLIEFLARDGKDFDPPLAELATLRKLMVFKQDLDIIRFFILMADRKIQVNPDQRELIVQLKDAKSQFERVYPGKSLLRIKYPFIGGPRIEGV
ncbi:MAG: toll/interleukin-1 receptor domain-containing protein [Proteobacteria bacterium]|nr:toll/interleukin-1 receptor domain-containing protein [Pseudomonadota bacterium]MBU1582338.1 toll/interleukin-1 receptor domain-containing protein [Pseudomonadota bacterium]MBU2452753.1 toll/interleukin-1 receptor domain-containing protein [Pseudomonadota bacterium]MBU2631203.1 toll/interleukin-1 receptor domain-containing protein [Pseudomonadota bacterium]